MGRDEQAERFLDCFSEVEQILKNRLGRLKGDKSKFHQLVGAYLQRNPYWREDADDLDLYADIRNILSHQRSIDHGHPVRIPPRTVNRLGEILARLANPVPIGRRFERAVTTVTPDDPLSGVLARAYELAFSQFPVVDSTTGRFQGLITENAVARFLGRRSRDGAAAIDLGKVTVRQVTKEEEPGLKATLFKFRRLSDPEVEVMSLFAVHPDLEVVLLSEDGTNRKPILGIITEWDAARYSSR